MYDGANEPAYYEPDYFPWITGFTTDLSSLRERLGPLLGTSTQEFRAYFHDELASKKQHWKTYDYYFMGIRNERHCQQNSQLDLMLRSIPNMVSAGLSQLAPSSSIREHHGDTNGIIRCHFGLSIPDGLPNCGFTVNGIDRAWSLDRPLLFCDAKKHAAFNNTHQSRLLLIIDVIRPEFVKDRKKICRRVRSILWAQHLEKYFSKNWISPRKILPRVLIPLILISDLRKTAID